MRATLVCPGLTLDWDKVDIDAPVLACVNTAVRDAPRCDYWISADDMREIHLDVSPRAMRLGSIVVADASPSARSRRGRWGNWSDWIDTLVPAQKLVLRTWHPPNGISRHCKFSMTFALCYLHFVLGVTEINCYGSGLSGLGYYTDELEPHWHKHNGSKGEGRWKAERLLLSRAVGALYREHGVRVRRVM